MQCDHQVQCCFGYGVCQLEAPDVWQTGQGSIAVLSLMQQVWAYTNNKCIAMKSTVDYRISFCLQVFVDQRYQRHDKRDKLPAWITTHLSPRT